MNPIKSITLTNFQSHTNTTIRPAPGGQLTVITGCSDSGKTACIRALKWLLYNQPQGADFMRTGAKFCRVSVEYGDPGTGEVVATVIRERTAGTNRYKIIKPGKEPEVFEGFGGNVPLEVVEITGVQTVKIADQDLLLNLSEQLDGPFLGSKSTISSPGRAKILGKLAGTEEIDVASTETGRDLFRRNQDEKRLTEEIELLTNQIAEFDYLEKLAKKIERLEAICLRVKESEVRRINLENLKIRLHEIERQSAAACDVLLKWNGVEGAEILFKAAVAAQERLNHLQGARIKIDDLTGRTEESAATLRNLKGLEVAEAAVRSAEGKLTRAKSLHLTQVKLGQIAADLNACTLELKKPRVVNLEKIAAAVKVAEDAAQRAGTLAILKGRLAQIGEDRAQAERRLQQWEDGLPDMERDYLETLKAAGVCPTCGNTEFDISRLKEAI